MRFNPHKYQQQGIDWIIDHPRCALFWGMGLGKSVVTLTAIQQLIDRCEVSKALVIAPKKVAETTWSDEAGKWDHLQGLCVSRVLGNENQRLAALAAEADVYVIGRDNIPWLAKHYRGRLPFDIVVLDELTSFKSPKAQRFKALRLCTAATPRVVGLTGTPTPNGLTDLWAQLYCIDRGKRLGQFVTHYRQTYFSEYRVNNIPIRLTPKPGAREAIERKIADICLTMQAKDYLELPPLMEHTVNVQLPDIIRKKYCTFEREQVLEFVATHDTQGPVTILATSALSLMNKLSQFTAGLLYDAAGCAHHLHSAKAERVAEIVEEAQSSVLVFYQYRSEIPLLRDCLKGLRVQVYEGEQNLKDWNAGKVDVLIAHPASTAYGLNLQQGGHVVVWTGTGWNLELYQQANARLHRQGQTQPVQVYLLVCPATVDERARAAISGKRQTQAALLDALSDMVENYTPHSL